METPNNPFCTWRDEELWRGHMCAPTPVLLFPRGHGHLLQFVVLPQVARLGPLRPKMKQWWQQGEALESPNVDIKFAPEDKLIWDHTALRYPPHLLNIKTQICFSVVAGATDSTFNALVSITPCLSHFHSPDHSIPVSPAYANPIYTRETHWKTTICWYATRLLHLFVLLQKLVTKENNCKPGIHLSCF